MPSPVSIRHDALKDSEARIRALTREVGTLREELRRETKRRERAVAQVNGVVSLLLCICHNCHAPMQAKQSDEDKSSSMLQSQELQYANKKLSAELKTAQESHNVGAERNKRALRSLREGLASVESAVALRAQQGKELLGASFDCLAKLKQQLFQGGGNGGLTPELEVHVTVLLAEAVRALGQLEHLLVGPGEGGSGDILENGHAGVRENGRGLRDASYNLERVSHVEIFP